MGMWEQYDKSLRELIDLAKSNERKKVCDEIRDKFIDILNVNDGHYSYNQLDDDFNNILDQIEKGSESDVKD